MPDIDFLMKVNVNLSMNSWIDDCSLCCLRPKNKIPLFKCVYKCWCESRILFLTLNWMRIRLISIFTEKETMANALWATVSLNELKLVALESRFQYDPCYNSRCHIIRLKLCEYSILHSKCPIEKKSRLRINTFKWTIYERFSLFKDTTVNPSALTIV